MTAGSLLGLVWKLVILGGLAVGAWYLWQNAPTMWSKVRLNADVESASVFFMHQIPREFAKEEDLERAIANSAEDKLKSHLAYKARWYVAYGPRADELKVVRNDEFLPADKTFFAATVDQARRRGDVPGIEHQTLSFPRGALTRTVSVGGAQCYVVAGWSEEGK